MVQIWILSGEWFVRYTPLEKLSRNSVKNFVHERDGRTNKRTDTRTDERKGENYIPFGINAEGINSPQTRWSQF